MFFWIITILIATIIVILGVLILLKIKIPDNKKIQILILISILLYLSLSISYFKQQRLFNFSLLNSRYRNQIQKLFTNYNKQEKQQAFRNIYHFYHQSKIKSQILNTLDYTHFYQTNYYSYPYSNKKDIQKIIFTSCQYDGASFFIQKLVQNFRSYNVPTLYIHLQSPIYIENLDQFAQLFRLPNFLVMRQAFLSFSYKNARSYLVIDNPQYLFVNLKNNQNKPVQQLLQWGSGKFVSQIDKLIHDAKISVILNIQKKDLASIDSVVANIFNMKQFEARQWKLPTIKHIQEWVSKQNKIMYLLQSNPILYNFYFLDSLFNSNINKISNDFQLQKYYLSKMYGVQKSRQAILQNGKKKSNLIQIKKLPNVNLKDLKKLQQIRLAKIDNGTLQIF